MFPSAFCIQLFTPGVVGVGADPVDCDNTTVRVSAPVEQALSKDFWNLTPLMMMLDPHPGRQDEAHKGP